MTSVTYTFNLDPVVSAASQRTYSAPAESTAAIGAKYQAAQPTVQGGQGIGGIASPACEGGDCYVVHGDGPGVTTLAIGEEDGGTGEFLSLPIVDGVEFMEPPVTSFASAGDYQISTLAIGEEDSGFASAAPEIGAPDTAMTAPVSNAVEYVEQMAIEPMPIAKPEVASFQTATSFESAPVPASKPETFFNAAPLTTSMPVPNSSGDLGTQDYVSVGSYDSYLSSENAGATTAQPETAAVVPIAEDVAPPPALATGETETTRVEMTFQPATSTETATETAAVPASLTTTEEVAAPSVELVFQPATGAASSPGYTIQEVAPPSATEQAISVDMETLTSPRMKPASLTTPGPAALPPIDLGPIETVPMTSIPGAESNLGVVPQQTFIDSGSTIGAIDAPFPSGKPEGIAGDVPRLSEDDYRITTLALGEEDAGGG